jgi:hypothetical protein
MIFITCVVLLDTAYGSVIDFYLRGTFKFLAFFLITSCEANSGLTSILDPGASIVTFGALLEITNFKP